MSPEAHGGGMLHVRTLACVALLLLQVLPVGAGDAPASMTGALETPGWVAVEIAHDENVLLEIVLTDEGGSAAGVIVESIAGSRRTGATAIANGGASWVAADGDKLPESTYVLTPISNGGWQLTLNIDLRNFSDNSRFTFWLAGQGDMTWRLWVGGGHEGTMIGSADGGTYFVNMKDVERSSARVGAHILGDDALLVRDGVVNIDATGRFYFTSTSKPFPAWTQDVTVTRPDGTTRSCPCEMGVVSPPGGPGTYEFFVNATGYRHGAGQLVVGVDVMLPS